jgi:hypothetical protein
MTIHLLALGNRARTITTVVVLVITTMLVSSSLAQGASRDHRPMLSQGVGMGSKPSVRVRAVQRVLHRRGYDLGAPGVDGRFGPLTDAAVRRLQANSGLVADGVVGDQTRRALRLSRAGARRSVQPRRTQEGDTSKRSRASTRTGSAPELLRATRPASTPRNATAPSTPWLAAIAAGGAVGLLITALSALGLSQARRRRYGDAAIEGDGPHGASTGSIDVHQATSVTGAVDAPAASQSGDPVIGYVTVPAAADDDAVASACEAIEARCARSGWNLVEVVRDRDHGPTLERPGLVYALERIRDGDAHALVMSDLQRASRSAVDLGALMEWFRDADATLIALDLDLDTSTAVGRSVAGTLITVGGWQRERIARRTRAGLA